MPRRKREEYIYQRAYELAASGLHISPITVVSAIVDEGYPEAAELLSSDIVRQDLRQVCAAHWSGGAFSMGEEPVVPTPPATVAKPDRKLKK